MAISTKVSGFIERASWIRKMFEEGSRLKAIYGEDQVFDFTLGNPSTEPPKAFNKALQELALNPQPGMHRYMNNAGYPETREAVARHLSKVAQSPVEAGHIIMTCGAGGALNVTLKTILDPGDEVIILAPYFVEYIFYVDNHGGTTKTVPTRKDSFQLDIDAIEAAIGPKTRAIIINSPNNPTGVIYPPEDLQTLGDMLERKQQELDRTLFVLSDEPYARLSYDHAEVPCIFSHVRNAVIVTSHSKDLALPGERIGYLAANPAMDEVQKFMEGAIFCNRVLGFVNAPALMQRLVAGLQDESVDIADYQAKRDVLYNHLSALGFRMVKPQGGFYLFPESPMEDDVAFARLTQEHRVLVVPGQGFGTPGYFRIAYCIPMETIQASLPAWEKIARDTGLC
ncbi:amino acid aminotransferase, putative [Syntrophotalea carbinolica DSM 2380]|uniref:Amino acid aminotransferase, putative n=1 Tax=Syntrophotalea carbinolica (strain DSM 2380 / NBRC 103641 / GraBd1) TaxID=338963 RepID=Q3A3C8_SYNC1|nr:pyridoxal phosphate-dependent aminotransferase [Syntrophotalea carbinolica]ABA89129.1 amino acid aminotransferase, putative [Syntrophotalea carbinolica DSM 2380]